MSRGFSRSSRARHADRVLRAEDPKKEGRALAEELGVNFGALWSWVLMPVDLLLDLLRQKRFMGMMAHRSGPRELLEGVLAEERNCSEAALTLLYCYYSKEDVPASDFERLLRESWHMEIVRKWAREDHAFTPDKLDVLRTVLAEDSTSTSVL